MVNKRGLSPDEYFSLDPEVLNMLMIYDAYIEPSGTYIDMLFHAYQCYNTTINNHNLTSEARKALKVNDFDFLGILDSDLTFKERAEERERNKKQKQSNDFKALGEAIKNQVLGKNKYGK